MASRCRTRSEAGCCHGELAWLPSRSRWSCPSFCVDLTFDTTSEALEMIFGQEYSNDAGRARDVHMQEDWHDWQEDYVEEYHVEEE